MKNSPNLYGHWLCICDTAADPSSLTNLPNLGLLKCLSVYMPCSSHTECIESEVRITMWSLLIIIILKYVYYRPDTKLEMFPLFVYLTFIMWINLLSFIIILFCRLRSLRPKEFKWSIDLNSDSKFNVQRAVQQFKWWSSLFNDCLYFNFVK